MGTFQDIRENIEYQLNSNWSMTDISWDNVPYKPKSEVPFIRPLIDEVAANQVSMGSSPCHRIIGLIHILIMVPVGTGTHTARGYADSLSDIFRNASFGGITCRSPRIARVGDIGEHFQYSWLVDFWVDSI